MDYAEILRKIVSQIDKGEIEIKEISLERILDDDEPQNGQRRYKDSGERWLRVTYFEKNNG
jgi:hypothetical protein